MIPPGRESYLSRLESYLNRSNGRFIEEDLKTSWINTEFVGDDLLLSFGCLAVFLRREDIGDNSPAFAVFQNVFIENRQQRDDGN